MMSRTWKRIKLILLRLGKEFGAVVYAVSLLEVVTSGFISEEKVVAIPTGPNQP
jgi:hypothetical protein